MMTTWAPGMSLEEIERRVILAALRHAKGNRTITAEELGISIRTLRIRLALYRSMGIEAEEYQGTRRARRSKREVVE